MTDDRPPWSLFALGSVVLAAVLAIYVLVGCAGPSTTAAHASAVSASPDDRADLQALLVPGDVYLTSRTYVLGQSPGLYWSIDVPAGVRLHGNGAVLQAADGLGASIRLLHVSGADVLIEGLELVGNKTARPVSEQSHGLFAQDAPGLRIRSLTAHDFPGDGIALYSGVSDAVVEDVTLRDNNRDGLSVIGAVSRLLVERATLRNNRAQQFDSEPGGSSRIDDVTLSHLTVDPGTSTDWGVTISGASALAQGGPWRIVDSTIGGGVLLTWARDVVLAGNTITGGAHPAIEAYRTCTGIDVVGNTLTGSVTVIGTGSVGQQPSGVRIVGNKINGGVGVEGALDLTLTDNAITGTAGTGVALRATVPEVAFARATVARNTISGFGVRGLLVMGYGASRLGYLELAGNSFSGVPTAALLDDGTHALQSLAAYDNRYGAGVARIAGIPPACDVMLMRDLP